MNKQRILLVLLCILVGWGGAGMAYANVTFETTDNPGSWFDCSASTGSPVLGCVPAEYPAGTKLAGSGKSLAIIGLGESITFQSTGQANTLHTVVSLMYPSPIDRNDKTNPMPFDDDLLPKIGKTSVTPRDLGLHVFFCDIHPYMFAAVIVVPKENTLSSGQLFPLDLGKTLDLHKIVAETLPGLPTASDLALRLVHTFFIITNPDNWQQYTTVDRPWKPAYPSVPVVAYVNGVTPATLNLDEKLRDYFGEGGPTAANHLAPYLKTLSHPIAPATPGVGQVWVDTQFEMMHEKNKPGTVTAVNATSWTVERKVGLPHHGTHHGDGMNNPHNMWTDKDQTVIYQTEWFDHYLSVFNRKTGAFVRRIETGLAPAHVMTRTNNDQVHVSQNGDNNVREFDSLEHGNGFLKDIPMVNTVDPDTGEPDSAHPHAHWMSADGNMMVVPNPDTENSTVYSFKSHTGKTADVGHFPIATGMMPDSSKYYVANFLDSSITVMRIVGGTPHVKGTINLLNTNITDNPNGMTYVSGGFATDLTKCANAAACAPIGGLPIQTPVSPDGKYVIVANTMLAKILVIDTNTDTVVAKLDCDAGCHGVQFGAKKGGGYYAYVSSKFSNRMIVVDPKGGSNAAIVGSVLLTTTGTTAIDGSVSKYAGMGGQGVLPIPVVYNGWVQNLPEEWSEKLTHQQRHPIGVDPR
jgi:DNA-binding beta-propeller fold protein YncE